MWLQRDLRCHCEACRNLHIQLMNSAEWAAVRVTAWSSITKLYICACVLVFNSDYSSSLQIRLIGQRRRPVIDDGAPAAAAAAHADDLIRCFVKSVGKIASAFVSPNTQMHAHNLQESLKTQTEESCCYVRCEFGDSLNRPPKQSQLDFRELNVLDFNKNKWMP